MGFFSGFATGVMGQLNNEMADNKKKRDQARADAFKTYRDDFIPKYNANKEKASKMEAVRDDWVQRTGSKDFGDMLVKNEVTDYAAAQKLAMDYDFSSVKPAQAPAAPAPTDTPNALGAGGAGGGGPTQTAPTMEQGKALLKGAVGQDMQNVAAKGAGGFAGPDPAAPAPTPAAPAQAPAAPAPIGGKLPSQVAAPDAAQVMAGKGDSQVPEDGNLWDRIMGKPSHAKARAEAIDQLAVERGVDRATMQKMLTSNPVEDLKGQKKGDGKDGLTYKKPLDTVESALVANTLQNIDRFHDAGAVWDAVQTFNKTRDSKAFGATLRSIGFQSRPDEMAYNRQTQLLAADHKSALQKIQEQSLAALYKAGSPEALRDPNNPNYNPGAAAVLEWQIGLKRATENPVNAEIRRTMEGGASGVPNPNAPPPAASGKGSAAAKTTAPAAAPGLPKGVPEGSMYSPSRNLWRDQKGNFYKPDGTPVQQGK